jgi:peptidoglycan/LPS O-acetylase OafA/YrhL
MRSVPGNVARQAAEGAVPRLHALDGMRGLAILVVLIGHGANTANSPGILAPFRDIGLLGVQLFFAISGFIITLLLVREHQARGRVDLRRFWLRRALRILPPFVAACAGIGLVGYVGLMQWWWTSFFGAITFTKDTRLFGGDWFFGHFWSLSVEEQFYLIWPPLLAFLAAGRRAAYVAFGLMLASPVLAQLCARVCPQLVNLLPMIPHLAAGCLLALLLRRDRSRFVAGYRRHGRRFGLHWWLPPLAFFVAWLDAEAYAHDFTIPLTALLVPATSFVLLCEAVLEDGYLHRVLAHGPLWALGVVSYSVYLWQQIFLGPPHVYSSPWYWSEWPQNIVAAVVCGSLAYALIERPAAALKRRLDAAARR